MNITTREAVNARLSILYAMISLPLVVKMTFIGLLYETYSTLQQSHLLQGRRHVGGGRCRVTSLRKQRSLL